MILSHADDVRAMTQDIIDKAPSSKSVEIVLNSISDKINRAAAKGLYFINYYYEFDNYSNYSLDFPKEIIKEVLKKKGYTVRNLCTSDTDIQISWKKSLFHRIRDLLLYTDVLA